MDLLPNLPDMLALKEVAALLKLSPLTITRLIEEGALHTEENMMIRKSVLIDFLDDNLTLNQPLMEVDDGNELLQRQANPEHQ